MKMRIIFSELMFSVILINGILRVYLASPPSSDQWIVGHYDESPVASLYFAGQNFVWSERVI